MRSTAFYCGESHSRDVSFKMTRGDKSIDFQSEKKNFTWMKLKGKDYPRVGRTGKRTISLSTIILL